MKYVLLFLVTCSSASLFQPSASAATDIPVTGEAVPELAAFDVAMTNVMRANSIKGGALAVMKDGRLVLKHGYGWSDKAQTVPFNPDLRYRIASNSKTFTAAGIKLLVERGVIAADTLAVLFVGIQPYNGKWGDERFVSITVNHLIAHRSGFQPDYSWNVHSTALGLDHPATPAEALSSGFSRPLDFHPGTQFTYSGWGYLLLGRVLEKASGLGYETFIQRHVARTWGIPGVQLTRTEPKLRPPDEPHYDDSGSPAGPNLAAFPTEEKVPQPDGAEFYYESVDAGGGLMTSVEGLVRLAQVCLISHGSAFSPSARIPLEMNGDRRRWRHIGLVGGQLGGVEGAALFNFQNTNGVDFAVFFNRRDQGSLSGLVAQLKRLTETTTVWPGDNLTLITLAADAFTVGEEEGELVVGLRRTGESKGEVSLNYATADGSAHAGTDFTTMSGTLTFADDEITQTITIPITNNTGLDGNRIFTLNLSSAASAQLGIATATITIEDDDAPHLPPTIEIVSPHSGDLSPATTNLTITANVSTGSRPLSKIEYFAGPTLLGEENKAPYTFTWKKPGVGSYRLTAVATDDRGVWSPSAPVPITVGTNAMADQSGPLLREFWMRRPGATLSNLTAYAHFPARPTGWQYLDTFEEPANWGDYYGSRITGCVVPPVSGAYTFWIASDDQAQLWLADSETPGRKQLIASVNSPTAPRQWDSQASQKSAPVTLLAGRRYYLEALHKERVGNDHLAVGWQLPNGTLEQPIPGSRFVGVNGVSELDSRFKPLPPKEPGQVVPPEVGSIFPQPDARIIAFSLLFIAGRSPTVGLARFNYDGTVDTTFSPSAHAFPLGLQSDGKILILKDEDGVSRLHLIRLNSDGSVDPGFKFELPFRGERELVLEEDGQILLAMMTGGGVLSDSKYQILRLDSDSSPDRTFQPFNCSVASAAPILRIASQTNGRLLVSGNFRGPGALDKLPRVIRLNADGSLDASFAPAGPAAVVDAAGSPEPGYYAWIDALAMQPDGKVLVVGNFNQFAGVRCGSIVRLNVDGTVDSSFKLGLGARVPPCRFTPGLTSPSAPCLTGQLPARIWRIALQPGGKIVIAGMFDHFDSVPRLGLARLHPDGSLDATYALSGGLLDEDGNPALLWALAIESNGDILVGGAFSKVEGVAVSGLARLNGELSGGAITGWNASTHTLTLATYPGRTHVLEVSDDLAEWLPLRTNTASGPLLELADTDATSFPRRFYRARVELREVSQQP